MITNDGGEVIVIKVVEWLSLRPSPVLITDFINTLLWLKYLYFNGRNKFKKKSNKKLFQ